MTENELARIVFDSGLKVHKALGPGLLESAYEACLAYQLCKDGLNVERQVVLPIEYCNEKIDAGYRIDLRVDGRVIVEVKSVQLLQSIHEAQLLSYLRLSGLSVGLLINFNVRHLKDGIKRMVNDYHPPTREITTEDAVVRRGEDEDCMDGR